MAEVGRALLVAWLTVSAILLPVTLAPWTLPERSLLAAGALCHRGHPGGRACALCGMTRAFVSIGRGEWSEARRWNPASLPLYGVLAANEGLAAGWLIFRRRKRNGRIIGVGIPMRFLLAMLVCGALGAAEKAPPAGEAANEKIRIRAWLYADAATLRGELGSDLGGYYTVVRVEVVPQGGETLAVVTDDFLLRSNKDGQRSRPLAAGQVAGRGVLVVSTKGGGGLMAENPGPVWGGWPGPPRRLGGETAVIGNASESTTQAAAREDAKSAGDPLLETLKAKALPEGETAAAVNGLLYFLLEGKHRPRNLELVYHGPAGKLSLRFR